MRSGAHASGAAAGASRWWRAAGAGPVLAYPFVAHLAVRTDRFAWALALLAALACYLLVGRVRLARGVRWLLPPLAAWLALQSGYDGRPIVALVPTFVFAALGCWFGSTLAAGRKPLVSRFAELEQGALDRELARYTRRLTWVWTIFFALMAVTSLLLLARADRQAWSIFTNFASYLLIAALFLAEYAYRRWRYRAYRHHSLVGLMRNVARSLRP